MNQRLATAYDMNEDPSQLWSQSKKEAAETFLYDSIYRAGASRIPMQMYFARILAVHRTGFLAWYDHPISTEALEGIINKIKTMKRSAYGFPISRKFL